jgi:uncharacterized protein YndB with AHSA1/START domain
MREQPSKTRSHEHQIEIDAPIEAVWKALTEAEQLINWFSEEARVVPGEGGSIWVSWGEGQAGESRIEDWEPGRRLRLSQMPAQKDPDPNNASPFPGPLDTPLIQEYTLESRGGLTVLRLVHSSIPNTAEWDAYYDGTNRGWDMFFQGLRHYLEKAGAKTRKTMMIMQPILGGLEEAWTKLTGSEGLAARGTLEGLSEGSRYSVTTSNGDDLQGEVILNLPPKTITLTVESLDNALLSATLEEMGGATYFYMTLATYGWSPDRNEALGLRWSTWMQKLFPPPQPNTD